MKLQHLQIGNRFEYEGKVYVKTGPLTASSEEGGQRIIPRYAVLRPLDLPETNTDAGKEKGPSNAAVRAAFQTFCTECAPLLAAGSEAAFEAARKRFLDRLR